MKKLSTLIFTFLFVNAALFSQANLLHLDGTDDYVNFGDINAIDGISEATIELWINPQQLYGGSYKSVFAKYAGSTSKFEIAITTDEIGLVMANGANTYANTNSDILTIGEWVHIALVFDGNGATNSDRLKVYANGVEHTLTYYGGNIPTTTPTNNANALIGSLTGSSQYLNMNFEELRIWSEARTADEIRTYMHQTLTGTETNLVAYYQFDETAGTTTIQDKTSNNNDGTWSGASSGSNTSSNFISSDAPTGDGTTSKIVGLNSTGNQTFGDVSMSFSDAFDNSQDVYVTAITSGANATTGISESNSSNPYYIIKNYENGGTAGTFSTDFTFNNTSIHNTDITTPSNIKLYKRGSNDIGTWTNNTTGNSATSSSVTFSGISAFSQYILASDNSTLNNTNTLTNGLIAYYPFNGNANDESNGGTRNGAVNGATLTTDRFGNANSAYDFDGNDYIEMTATGLPTGERTVSLWYNISSVNNRPGLLGYGGLSCGSSWFMGINHAGQNAHTITSHCGNNELDATYTQPPLNDWHHLLISTDANGTYIYVDGVLENSNANFINNTYVNGKELSIGVITGTTGFAPYTDGNIGYTIGKLDDIRIYNRALTLSEVQELSNNQSADYKITNTSVNCTDTLLIPIEAINTVSNVIGYDITMIYDSSKVTPTGDFIPNSDLINANYVDDVMNILSNNNQLYLSLFLNSAAPANTTWNGTGIIGWLKFVPKSSFSNDTAWFNISQLMESYYNTTQIVAADSGFVFMSKDTTFEGNIVHWAGKKNIGYNATGINTNIQSTDNSCNSIGNTTTPDANEQITYPLSANATHLQLSRDIKGDYTDTLNSTNVMAAINGYDAYLAQQVTTMNTSVFTPNIYQIMAMDVNQDGVVSAGDISQINQRTILNFHEFKQPHNYYSNGDTLSGYEISKDWAFIDTSTIVNSTAHQISTTYPLDDGVGFSKFSVPTFENCLALPITGTTQCPQIDSTTFVGVLLGDIDGNVHDTITGSHLFKNGAEIVFHLNDNNVQNNVLSIPVLATDLTDIFAVDYTLHFDNTKLSYIGLTPTFNANQQSNRYQSSQVLMTSYDSQNYPMDTVAYLQFNLLSGMITPNDFPTINGYINGEAVTSYVTGMLTKTNEIIENTAIQIIPNPNSGNFNLSTTDLPIGKWNIEIYNITGQLIHQQSQQIQQIDTQIEIDVKEIESGVYFLKMVGVDGVMVVKKFVVR